MEDKRRRRHIEDTQELDIEELKRLMDDTAHENYDSGNRYNDEEFVTSSANQRRSSNQRRSGGSSGNRGPRPQNSKNSQRPQSQKRRRKKNKHLFGKALAVVQMILTIVLALLFKTIDILPVKFLIPFVIVALVIAEFCFLAQNIRKTHIAGKVVSLICCVVMGAGIFYLNATKSALDTFTAQGSDYQKDNMVVAVLTDDPATSLAELQTYTFGLVKSTDNAKAQETVTSIEEHLGATVKTEEYNTLKEQVQAFLTGECGVIVFNKNEENQINEAFPNFSDKIRVLESYEITTEVKLPNVPDLPVTQNPFTVYISGIDTSEEREADVEYDGDSGRSDVNIIAVVNPVTKQILIVSTPRDFYVVLPEVSAGQYDKLTHAGSYGIQCSMDTLAYLYDVEIDYYVRLNFDAMINIVDALGGVDVDSEQEFTSYYKEYSYTKGINHLDGEYALEFCRERYVFDDGDFQRGRNQEAMLKAMLQKAMSPAILTGYLNILNGIKGDFEMNFTTQQIASLVKMQLNDGASWNIVTYSPSGDFADMYCYSGGNQLLSVTIPYQPDIDTVVSLVDQVYAGQIIESPTSETDSSVTTDSNTVDNGEAVYGDTTYGDTTNNAYSDVGTGTDTTYNTYNGGTGNTPYENNNTQPAGNAW